MAHDAVYLERRKFLVGLLAGAAAFGANLPALDVILDEDKRLDMAAQEASFEAGESLPINPMAFTPNNWANELEPIREALLLRAREILVPGSRFEVRISMPSDFGRTQGIAWYATGHMQRDPGWYPEWKGAAIYRPHLGIYDFGRYVA